MSLVIRSLFLCNMLCFHYCPYSVSYNVASVFHFHMLYFLVLHMRYVFRFLMFAKKRIHSLDCCIKSCLVWACEFRLFPCNRHTGTRHLNINGLFESLCTAALYIYTLEKSNTLLSQLIYSSYTGNLHIAKKVFASY